MRTVLHVLGGLSIGAAATTILMIGLDQKIMTGMSALLTAVLVGLSVAVWYVDQRVRRMLMLLCEQLMEAALEQDKPLTYNSAGILYFEIKEGKSLTAAASELGHMSAFLDMTIDTESHV